MYYNDNYNPNRKYQLVIMTEEGKCHCVGPIHTWDEIQQVVKEMRELYETHGITHHVGFREV